MKEIYADELKNRLDAKENLYVIDIREKHEFEEFNLGSENVQLGELSAHLKKIDHLKDEEIIIICDIGHRSELAKNFMTELGFTKVRNLFGGLIEFKRTYLK